MKKTKDKLNKSLSILFWINIILVISIFLVVLWLKGPDFGNIPTSVSFERWAIILTLGSIPFALKMFHFQMLKYKDQDKNKLRKHYKQLYLCRLFLFDLILAMNIIGFQIYEASNFIYMTIIIIFALFFCYPNSKVYLIDQAEENTIE